MKELQDIFGKAREFSMALGYLSSSCEFLTEAERDVLRRKEAAEVEISEVGRLAREAVKYEPPSLDLATPNRRQALTDYQDASKVHNQFQDRYSEFFGLLDRLHFAPTLKVQFEAKEKQAKRNWNDAYTALDRLRSHTGSAYAKAEEAARADHTRREVAAQREAEAKAREANAALFTEANMVERDARARIRREALEFVAQTKPVVQAAIDALPGASQGGQ